MVSSNAENLLVMSKAQSNIRRYEKNECIFFRKTKEDWGGLSNMAGGYKIVLDGVNILTAEALYQACRFPHLPEVQKLILEQRSPMTAKMVGKPHRANTRPDWPQVRIRVMKWCIRVKLLNNIHQFGSLLLGTKDLPIVEWSRKDEFWGAKLYEEKYFIGINALGRLLMELREDIKVNQSIFSNGLEPLDIEVFDLLGSPIMVQHMTDKIQFNDNTLNEDDQLKLLD